MQEEEIRHLAKSYFDAAERDDVTTIEKIYADDIVMWHNINPVEKGRDDVMATLLGFFSRIKGRRYEDRKLDIFPGGFVQQHIVSGTRKDGSHVSMPVAVIARCRDGQIHRLDEYLDTPRVQEFRQAF